MFVDDGLFSRKHLELYAGLRVLRYDVNGIDLPCTLPSPYGRD
jgi:hypothetical protein